MSFRNWAKNFMFLILFVLSGLALIVIIGGLKAGSELDPFNTAVEQIIVHFRTPFFTNIMLAITNLGSPLMLTIISIFLAIIIVIKKDTYDTLLFIVSITLSIISFSVLKNVLHLSRPVDSLVHLSGWGFPSGHATVATTFFFSVAYSFFDHFKSAMVKVLLVGLCMLGAASICLSRVYLGAHFALDVLGGIALGLLVSSFTVLIFNMFLEEKRSLRKKRI